LRNVEEEPYAICRFLRATKFDADKILERLEDNKTMWKRAHADHFYPDISNALNCPFSVFLTQYPFLAIGRGKNACPVNYFQAGKVHPEGMFCATTVQKVEAYFWHQFVHGFQKEVQKSLVQNPNLVRMEGINILDLKGLSASAISTETLEVVKLASKIADFFPEVSNESSSSIVRTNVRERERESGGPANTHTFFFSKTDIALHAHFKCSQFLFADLGDY
jgi:hypothetical protein